LADAERARRAKQDRWSSYHRGAYRLLFAERAPTAALAVQPALARCASASGWVVEGDARPGA
jgi:hypothetical protein